MPLRPDPLRRRLLALPIAAALAGVASLRAQGVELSTLALRREDGALSLDFVARVSLSRTVEEALLRGVPVYFSAQATLLRSRWYWRDERIARLGRSWRLAHQPLTGTWRVALGALSQTHASLAEALDAITRLTGWKLAELSQIDPDSRHYVEFAFRLDTSQLPSPMQIGLTGQSDWTLGVERTLRLD
jgi:hypothetical protein